MPLLHVSTSAALQQRYDACLNLAANARYRLVLVPLHGMSIVDAKGADAKQFLQSKLTTDLKKLDARGAAYGYATDINGRVIFDAHIAKIADNHYRMWSEPESEDTIVQALDKYIILEDVTLETQPATDLWMLAGDSLESLHTALETEDQPTRGYAQHQNVSLLTLARSARPAILLQGDSKILRQKLSDQGAVSVPWEEWRTLEIEEGFVRTKFDLIPEQTIPLEAGPDLGVDYNKGCYLGQEVIERLRSRGTPNREYRRVNVGGPMDPYGPIGIDALPVELVDKEGKNAGSLMSMTTRAGVTQGIAVIRRKYLQNDAEIFVKSLEEAKITIVGNVR